ncbi:MAG TPA: metallophosphoesterase [Labilithrix sp.]
MTAQQRSSSPSIPSVPPTPATRAIGRRPRASRFFRILVTITAVTHAPFVVAAAEALRRLGVRSDLAWGGGAMLGLAGVALFVGRARALMHDQPRPFWRTLFVDLPFYAHWCATIWCLVPSVLYVLLEPIVDAIRGAPIGPSPGFFLWTYASGLVVCTYGVTVRRWFFQVQRHEVKIRGLAPELDGYRIVQLSDLHVGAMHPAWWAMRWAQAANAENADLAVVTGDMVTSGVAFHDAIASVIGALRAKNGVYVIMGNHDYFGEGEPLISLLNDGGARVLLNEGVVLERDGGKMYLAGIDDTWTKRADIDRALAARPDGMPTVLLAHDPEKFPQAVKRKVDLVLSGHTHGGQVAVPFLPKRINASKIAHNYSLGIYTDGDATLYVHPGLGTTGPPIRLGVAPAVVVLTLRSA